jgi:Tfp pilus assembly protein PilP
MQEQGKNKALLIVCLFLPLIFGMSPVETKPPEIKAAAMRTADVRTPEMKAPGMKAAEMRAAQMNAPEMKAAEMRAVQMNAPEMRALEMRAPEMRASEMKSPETKSPEKIRDPFQSPFAAELMQASQTPSSPILNYDLSELKLVGIVWGGLGRVAVVETPDGKCYLVKKNGEIGKLKGKVKEVGNDHLEVQATVTDYLGRIKMEEITVKLHKEETPVSN